MEFQQTRFDAISPAVAAKSAKDLEDASVCLVRLKAGTLKPDSPGYTDCIDPPNPNLNQTLNALELQRQLSISYQETVLSEYESLGGESSRQVARARRSYGDLPLVVLTAGDNFKLDPDKPDEVQAKQRALWMQMHDELAALSTHGVNRVVEGAKHNIQSTKPEAVIEAVREVIAAAAGTAPAAKGGPG